MNSCQLIVIAFLGIFFQSNRAHAGVFTRDIEAKNTLLIVLDKSVSMQEKSKMIEGLVQRINSGFPDSCSFNIAIEEMIYQDQPGRALGLVGNPPILDHRLPIDFVNRELNDRLMLFGSQQSPEPGHVELPLTTVDRIFSRERNWLSQQKVIGTLLLTDTGTHYDELHGLDALARFRSAVGPGPELIFGGLISPSETNCTLRDRQLTPEERSMTKAQLLSLKRQSLIQIFDQSGGYYDDICDADYDLFFSEFILMLIDAGGCSATM